MHDSTLWQHDLLSFLRPDTLVDALICLVVFVLFAVVVSRGLQAGVIAQRSKIMMRLDQQFAQASATTHATQRPTFA